MFRYVESETPLTAMCPWCISEGDLIGWRTDMFRHHGWFKEENGHLRERPVFNAMRQLRSEREEEPSLIAESKVAKGLDLLPEDGEEPLAEAKTAVTITVQVKVEVGGKANDIEVKVDPGVVIDEQ
jgi:hypothetical protein